MKLIPHRIAPVLAVALLLTACSSKDPKSPSFIVAKGDGLKITRAELTKERDLQLKVTQMPMDKIPAPQLAAIEAQVLDQMINKSMLLKDAGKSTPEIQKQVKERMERVRQGFADEAAFKAQLAKAGLTPERMEEEMETQLLIEKTVSEKIKPESITVSPADVEAFYRENMRLWQQPDLVRARHILIRVAETASAEEKASKKKAIDAVRKRIAGGESFEKVAKEVSEDPGSAENGGLLPMFSKNQMVPEFERAAFSQDVNKLGSVVTSPYGYHIIEVLEKRAARTVPLEEVRDEINKHLMIRGRAKAVQALLAQMKKDAHVQVFLPPPPAPTPTSSAPAASAQSKTSS